MSLVAFEGYSNLHLLFTDLYRIENDPKIQEGSTMHNSFSQTLLQDHIKASQLAEHNLIEWNDGPFPALLPSATTKMTTPQPSI